ncbi:MAG TPA: hypothetical protein DCG25_09620 [Acidimicrobiaceae bacterium]|nr:hypothetical protein [Acidimicrobiaceae bacterium]
MTLTPRVLVMTRHFSERMDPVEAKLREMGVPVGVLDIDGLMLGRGKISTEHNGATQCLRFTDARTGQRMTDEQVTGIWLHDVSFVQVPMEKMIDGRDGRAYVEHIGQCEAWMTVMAAVGAASHGRVCLPNPMFTYLNTPLRHLQLARRLGIPTLTLCATRGPGPVYDLLSTTTGHLRRVPFRRFAFRYREKKYLSTESIIEADRSYALGWIRGAEVFTEWPESWCWYRIARLGGKTWSIRIALKDQVQSAQITDIAYHAARDQLDVTSEPAPSEMASAFELLCQNTESPYLVADFVQDLEGDRPWYFNALSAREKLTLFDGVGLDLSAHIARWLESGECPN